MDYQYRFNNEVLKMRMVHRKTGAKDLTELYEYAYNHIGVKTSFTHNGLVVAKYELDGINRLQNKKFRPIGTSQNSKQTGNWTDASSWLSGVFPLSNDNVTINTGHTLTIPNGQIASAGILNDKGTLRNFGTLNMGRIPTADLYVESLKYHIRGGLRGINLDASENLTNSLFSFKIEYEGNNGFFDGNIKNQYWKSNIDGIQRAYEYNYDIASRLMSGTYGSAKAGENYSLNNVTYDFNGNITNLSRNGWKSNNTFGLVDNLNYTYHSSSNKILKVEDASGETASFRDVAGNDYGYSPDGSLISDNNKGISVIEYNYLKLPKRVVQNGITTLYQYDASGKKLKETIGANVTDYSGNKIYKNNVLYQIGHDEGRIIDGEYEYNIKDHLGNLRVAFRDSLGIAKITQANSYGIFGEDLPTLSYLKQTWKADNFKFTGKESLQGTGFIDFGARWYDNIVPRFTTIDPLAEISRRFSPFVYANGNPILIIDPDGMQAQTIYDFNGKAHTVNDDEQTSIYQNLGEDDKDKGKQDKNGNTNFNGGYKDKNGNSHYYPAMDVTMTMSDEGKRIYDVEALKQTAFALIPWGRLVKILGVEAAFAYLGKALGLAIRAENFVAFGINGEGYTSKFLASVFQSSESSAMKVLYRGMTGSESRSGALFLTEDATYAATYAKNGLGVAEFRIPSYAYYFLKTEGLLLEKVGKNIITRTGGSEVMIQNPVIKDLILKSIIK